MVPVQEFSDNIHTTKTVFKSQSSWIDGQKGSCLSFQEATSAFTDSNFLWLFAHGAGGASILLDDIQRWLAEQMCQ